MFKFILILCFSVVSLNVRGIRNINKRKAIFLFLKDKRADFYLLQETHSLKSDHNLWKSQWGQDIWLSHGTNRSAGVAILKGNFRGKIVHTECNNGRWLILILEDSNMQYILANIYGTNCKSTNSLLFNELEIRIVNLSTKYVNAKIIIGGDFNVVPNDNLDRWPCKGVKDEVSNNIISGLCNNLGLTDVWRKMNPNKLTYTWQNSDRSLQSRIDFWLISEELTSFVDNVTIDPAIFTDHRSIHISFNTNINRKNTTRSGYWMLNNSLLLNDVFKREVLQIIGKYFKQGVITNQFGFHWELMKYKIRSLAINMSKTIAKNKRAKIQTIIQEFGLLCEKANLIEEEANNLIKLQGDLNKYYEDKAKGAFIRSRRKWIEYGEKNTRYFYALEKRNGERLSINKLRINGTITEDLSTVSKHISEFYQSLYCTSGIHLSSMESFLKQLHSINFVSDEFGKICEKELCIFEIFDNIKKLKDNKSPGNDGLTNEFFKTFGDALCPFILAMFNESIKNGTLPPSLRQGVITLIPKPNKDTLSLDGWRPITLLNTDAKLFSLIFANRLKLGLDSLIDQSQSGFMKGRHICNNLRLILDLIDYSHLLNDDNLILFLDFNKAFDTVEHNFIFATLEYFKFGTFFRKAITTLYTDCSSSVKMSHGTSNRFFLSRGIRQGCPISPFLFLLVTQVLSCYVNMNFFQGINVFGNELKICQLADDTTLFLKNAAEVSKAICSINNFSKISGLNLNVNKCEIFPLKSVNMEKIEGIPVKEVVTYLGIKLCKDESLRASLNFDPILTSTKRKFNSWLQRDLSIYGRVLLSKSEGLSRSAYISQALFVPKTFTKDFDRLLYDFIWKNKPHYLKKSIICNPQDQGGLNVVDFTTLYCTFKINWLKRFIKNNCCIWNIFPNYLFDQLGGIHFFLRCSFDVNKIPLKLSNFHRQVLLTWCLIFKHNFSPHSFFIWNNKYITHQRKSLFFRQWFDSNILLVAQLLDANGQILCINDLCHKFNCLISVKEYCIIVNSISVKTLSLFRNQSDWCNTVVCKVSKHLFLDNFDLINDKCCNQAIRSLFINISSPPSKFVWLNMFPSCVWENFWRVLNRYCISNKTKEVSFKIVHRVYPVKETLERFHLDIENKCSFCSCEKESIVHLFYECPCSSVFWYKMSQFLSVKLNCNLNLSLSSVVLHFNEYDVSKGKMFLIDLFLLLGKFYIHQVKWSNSEPNFVHFQTAFKIYLESIQFVKNKKARKTVSLLNEFNICL